jgi:hypothetical protein
MPPKPVSPAEIAADKPADAAKIRNNITHVENNTSHRINLPPAGKHPSGVRLLPGLNSVPTAYLDALRDGFKPGGKIRVGGQKFTQEDGSTVIMGGKVVTTEDRWPGREALELLLQPVRIVKASGEHFGPQITIYPDLLDREDGPMPPQVLPQNEEAAILIIQSTTSKEALQRWSKMGKGKVPQAAATKLATLQYDGAGVARG